MAQHMRVDGLREVGGLPGVSADEIDLSVLKTRIS
jgi:hypothetical protein